MKLQVAALKLHKNSISREFFQQNTCHRLFLTKNISQHILRYTCKKLPSVKKTVKDLDFKLRGPRTNESKYLCGVSTSYRNPVGNYVFKINNRNTRTRSEICSKLTIKIPESRHWRRSSDFIVNFEHISHLVLVFLLLTLSR